jgi:four helix bundle protein
VLVNSFEMEKFYYRRLDVYQNAKQLAIDVHELLKSFPQDEKFALTDQLRRASTSIMFNIAEGFGRYTNKERIRFLDIANGSLMEVASELELALSFQYLTTEEFESFDEKILIVVRQLAKLRSTIQV